MNNQESILQYAANRVADATAKLTKCAANQENFTTELVPVEEVSSLAKEASVSTVVALRFTGKYEGLFVLVLEPAEAERFALQVAGKHAEHAQSALKETGNILSGVFAAALNEKMGNTFVQSIPDSETDITVALLQTLVLEIAEGVDNMLTTQFDLYVENCDVHVRAMALFADATLS